MRMLLVEDEKGVANFIKKGLEEELYTIDHAENAEDGLFHPEAREVPAAVDDVAFLRSLAAAVLEGPRHPALLKPFPDGWTLRAAFRLADGLAVLDLAPPAPPVPSPEPTPGDGKPPEEPAPTPEPTVAEPPKRWEAGSSEEVGAVQSLVLTVTKNLPAVTRVILLVGGEPVETLAGHVDLTHPLLPDLSRAADEAPLVAPMPEPDATSGPAAPSPSAAGSATPPAAPPPAASPVPSSPQLPPIAAPRPAARPTPRPSKDSYRT